MREQNRELEKQILAKIEEMEDPKYEWPERFPRKHMVIVIVSVIACAVLLVLGARIA